MLWQCGLVSVQYSMVYLRLSVLFHEKCSQEKLPKKKEYSFDGWKDMDFRKGSESIFKRDTL